MTEAEEREERMAAGVMEAASEKRESGWRRRARSGWRRG